ncbi:hypothetical protein Poly51_60910 [Rubripirellula tenax]|uniref:DUF2760 domain-containing protein n=1 Tax=Rubripirellula tenax TaxID=2528015 RepID=A0A5C6E7I3_9BACT|nr:DUF2760 domain-containing protein [Rubripirellula tenax]TWU44525.1 hypothetical protein Poly51_60910 [Rubripirellula tenax]
MGLGIAIKAFTSALFDAQKSADIADLLAGKTAPPAIAPPTPVAQPAPAPAKPIRDSAVTLLATLQRESRLLDLLQEDLGKYSDAQVGAAARPCLEQSGGVLKRLFDIQPLVEAADGTNIDVASDSSPMRYQWVGESSGTSGKVIHHGWVATKVALPTWTGNENDANVIAPVQVQAN